MGVDGEVDAAAPGAEGLAAGVTMLIGNRYLPGHAGYALDLLCTEPGVRRLFARPACHCGLRD
jgi:L-erythro-3,5-diaminohexanoate dehydrogenase